MRPIVWGKGALVAVICLCLAAAGATPAEAQVDAQEGLDFLDTGPLRVREQFLLGMAFLAFEPSSADVLEPGKWQVDVVQSATNTWVQSDAVQTLLEERDGRRPVTLEELRAVEPEGERRGVYFADGELYRASVSVRRGLGKGLQLSLVVPLLNFQGGIGDSVIEGFHDSTGFSQAGRTGTFRDGYTVYLRDEEGNEVFRNRQPGAGIGDVALSLKARVPAPGDAWRVSAEGLVKLPTGDEEDLYGSGSVDFGVQLNATRYFARSCIHLSAGALFLGAADVYHLDEQTQLSAMLGYEHALGTSSSIIAQVTVFQSPFEDLGIQRLDDVAYLLDLGYKKGFGQNTVFFVALSENFLTFGSSADVGLHLGLTETF
jgi:hypothetical protein